MKFCLLDADYEVEDDATLIRLMGVNEEGKSVLVFFPYEPYFYVDALDKKKVEERLKKIRLVKKFEIVEKEMEKEKKDFLKVYVARPQDESKVRDLIKNIREVRECYEYGLTFYKRFLIDKNFYPFDWLLVEGEEEKEKGKFDIVMRAKKIVKTKEKMPFLRILAFDIEVVDSQIIMLSVADNLGFEKVLTYKATKAKEAEIVKNEAELLKKFEKIISERNPDIIVGYNSDAFDFEVIRNACEKNKISLGLGRDSAQLYFVRRAKISTTKLRGRIHIDLFNFINNILAPQLQSEVFTLAEVSKELINEEKVELGLEEICDAWKKGKIEQLTKYCLRDSQITLKLAQLLLPQIFALSIVSGQLPFDCSRLTYGLLVEWFLVRKAAEKNMIIPNTPHWEEIQKRRKLKPYKGAYVKEPKAGLYDNVAVMDFRSMYPAIIVTYNISPETFNCECCKKDGHKVPELEYYFCKRKEGFVSAIVKKVIEERAVIKEKLKKAKKNETKELNERQFALKTLANAIYGMFAYPGARWYKRECAESCAAFGRFNIMKSIKEAENFGFDVLYGDTDSFFVRLKKKNNIKKETSIFLKKINEKLPGILEIELQGIYKKGLFVPQRLGAYVAKKRYALLDEKGKLLVRGLETVRRDWADIAKNLQREILLLVLKGKQEEAVKKVKETIKKIKERKINLQEITIRTMLGKELEEYKAIGPHVMVAKKLKKEGHEILPGMVLSFIITKGKGSISERAEPINKVRLQDYDVEYYIKNQIISVALRVLQVLGYNEEDFLKKQKKLEEFSWNEKEKK